MEKPPRMLTESLATFAVRCDPVPPDVLHEAKRAILNVLAAALGAVDTEPVRIVLDWERATARTGPAQVWGHGDRLVPAAAALVNGTMAHVLDFDDTHPGTLIHVTAPVFPPVLHVAEAHGLDGQATLRAFAAGAEVALRVGAAVFPAHYDRGYHITATAGAIGAAAGAGRAMALTASQLTHALGIAATLGSGLREMFGSPCKAFQVGHAGRNGVAAAELAARGLRAAALSLEGPAGWAHAVAGGFDPGALNGLGEGWLLAENTYKPWACGLVAQPAVDGVLALRKRYAVGADDVEAIALEVAPRALELCGHRAPNDGLEAKFSVYHAAAVALIDGACREAHFTDRCVDDATVRSVRDRVSARADRAVGLDEARVELRLRDGRVVSHRVEHCLGSPANPLTDAMLTEKFHAAADGRLPAGRASEVVAMVWDLDRLPDVRALGHALRPVSREPQ